MRGFFPESIWRRQREPLQMVPQCGKCGLDKTCISPKMPVSGAGRRKILIVGEGPGANEDERGLQFVGNAGNELIRILHKVGINLRKDCWITNALICRPWEYDKDGIVINRKPSKDEIGFCRPNLANTIRSLKPDIIIPLGESAVRSIMPLAWKDGEVDDVGTWVGWQIPSIKLNAWICPTYHPSFLLHEKGPVAELLFTKHLRKIETLKGKPYPDGPPDYKKMVTCIYEADKAAIAIEEMVHDSLYDGLRRREEAKPIAFDYETTCLKPEWNVAKILCCSMSNGVRTIAYPMVGTAIEATKRFIRSDIPKIAANLPFEDRWSRKKLGVCVNNWLWDTLLGAHWLDCRSGIVSVKFQSFVLLGADDYSYIIDPDKGSKGGSKENNMSKVEISDLLLYGGLDALFEYLIAMKQMEKLPKPEPKNSDFDLSPTPGYL